MNLKILNSINFYFSNYLEKPILSFKILNNSISYIYDFSKFQKKN